MRSKLHWASSLAVAVTFLAALVGAEEPGAAEAANSQAASVGSAIRFTSEPVVQEIPLTAVKVDGQDQLADLGDEVVSEAQTLADLAAAQPHNDDLTPEMHCLAGAVYFESRGELLKGQLAVARVIVERASSERFPESYCGVVFQPSQFSFVRRGRMPSISYASEAWRKAVAIAQIADSASWDSPVEGALFFHATRISPGWRLKRLARVGNHVFYR